MNSSDKPIVAIVSNKGLGNIIKNDKYELFESMASSVYNRLLFTDADKAVIYDECVDYMHSYAEALFPDDEDSGVGDDMLTQGTLVAISLVEVAQVPESLRMTVDSTDGLARHVTEVTVIDSDSVMLRID